MYSIYVATSPSGRRYVGVTGQPVEVRWGQHARRARTGMNTPLYAAIRKYGADAFDVQTISQVDDESYALVLEIAFIALFGTRTAGYNLSAGGDTDHIAAVKKFHELREDPDWDAAYRRALSEGCMASERHRAWREGGLREAAARWKKEHPAEAWKQSRRASRMARGKAPSSLGRKATEEARENMSKAQRAARARQTKYSKKRHSIKAKRNAVALWANRTPDEMADVSERISAGLKERNGRLTQEEKAAHDAQLAQARQNIDHTKRKARQKEALIAYWTPERRAEKAKQMQERWRERRERARADV